MPAYRSVVFFHFLVAAMAAGLMGSANAQSVSVRWIPESGWYGEFVRFGFGNALGDRGRGVYLETQGETAVVTIMTYESDGRPVMLYAAGALRFEVGCVGLAVNQFTPFRSCLRDVDLYRISGGVPLGQQGLPAQPPRSAEIVGRLNVDASLGAIWLEIRPPNPPTQAPPPGIWPDRMGLQRLQWGYGGFGGNVHPGALASPGLDFPAPGACIPDFRGDWVLVEPANRSREARRLIFDQVEQVVPNFNCGLNATPEDAARIFVIFRDTQRQVELRCRASGCGYWDQGMYVGWVPRGFELKRFSVAVGVPDGGQVPTNPLSFRAGRLVAYRVE
jgi:hypothetical protein